MSREISADCLLAFIRRVLTDLSRAIPDREVMGSTEAGRALSSSPTSVDEYVHLLAHVKRFSVGIDGVNDLQDPGIRPLRARTCQR